MAKSPNISASAPSSPSGTSRPVRPSSINSGMPEWNVLTTGTSQRHRLHENDREPFHVAVGRGSRRKDEEIARAHSPDDVRPAERTGEIRRIRRGRVRRPRVCSFCRSGPLPMISIRKLSRTKSAPRRPSARNRTSKPFFSTSLPTETMRKGRARVRGGASPARSVRVVDIHAEPAHPDLVRRGSRPPSVELPTVP